MDQMSLSSDGPKVSMYRIEHRTREAGQKPFYRGVYRTGHIVGGGGLNCPPPCYDGIDYVKFDEHFGFTSLEQLCAWFSTEECMLMHASGKLVVRHYRGSRVRFGRKQMVMSAGDDVECVGEIPLYEAAGVDEPHLHPRYDFEAAFAASRSAKSWTDVAVKGTIGDAAEAPVKFKKVHTPKEVKDPGRYVIEATPAAMQFWPFASKAEDKMKRWRAKALTLA